MLTLVKEMMLLQLTFVSEDKQVNVVHTVYKAKEKINRRAKMEWKLTLEEETMIQKTDAILWT